MCGIVCVLFGLLAIELIDHAPEKLGVSPLFMSGSSCDEERVEAGKHVSAMAWRCLHWTHEYPNTFD